MLHDLANDGGYAALKWAAEDREGWRHRERMSKTCCTTVYYTELNYCQKFPSGTTSASPVCCRAGF